jgi:hypothetical protein
MENKVQTLRAVEAGVGHWFYPHCVSSHPCIHFIDMRDVNLVLGVFGLKDTALFKTTMPDSQ